MPISSICLIYYSKYIKVIISTLKALWLYLYLDKYYFTFKDMYHLSTYGNYLYIEYLAQVQRERQII
jgi:hypothetical protein